MEFYFLPLQELIGETPATKTAPTEVDLASMVVSACELKEPPAHTASTISRNDVQEVKDYLSDVKPEVMVPELAQSMDAAGLPPELALNGQSVTIYLKDMLPKSEFELTPFGLRPVVAPSFSEDVRFLWKCRIAENPFYIMNLFSQRQLTGLDIECVLAMYDTVYSDICIAMIQHIVDTYSTDSTIPRPLRTMLAILLQQPTIKLDQLAAYKAGDVQVAVNKTPPASQDAPQSVSKAESLLKD